MLVCNTSAPVPPKASALGSQTSSLFQFLPSPWKPCQPHKWVIQHLPLSHSFSSSPWTFFLTPLSSVVNPGPSHSLKQLLLQITSPWVICEWLFGGSSPSVLDAQGFSVHFHLNFFGTFTLVTPKLSVNNIPSYFNFPL